MPLKKTDTNSYPCQLFILVVLRCCSLDAGTGNIASMTWLTFDWCVLEFLNRRLRVLVKSVSHSALPTLRKYFEKKIVSYFRHQDQRCKQDINLERRVYKNGPRGL